MDKIYEVRETISFVTKKIVWVEFKSSGYKKSEENRNFYEKFLNSMDFGK